MKESNERGKRLRAWVNGEREPKDRTLFVMEKRRASRPEASPKEHETRQKHHLRKFLNWYPLIAAAICLALLCVFLVGIVPMPAFGNAENPLHNEVAQHYLERSEEETGAANAVTGMILSYRGFDTLGESCVLFLAVSCVMILLKRDRNNLDPEALEKARQEAAVEQAHPDMILRHATMVLVPCVFLFAIYVLLNGESSPGGGFSGGTILGCGLILYAAAFGFDRLRTFFSGRLYAGVRTFGLLLYATLYGYYTFMGANGLDNHIPLELGGLSLPIDLAVGLVVACTVYGFYSLFTRGDVS